MILVLEPAGAVDGVWLTRPCTEYTSLDKSFVRELRPAVTRYCIWPGVRICWSLLLRPESP